MALIVDIETVGLESSLAAEYPEAERNPPGNMTKADTIAAWREKDRIVWAAERSKECSLNPRLGRVLCIGMGNDKDDGTRVVMAKTEADEPNALREFWTEVNEAWGNVVTWNGMWDLRFIVIRSLAHGIKPTIESDGVRAWFKKYQTFPHFDVKSVLLNWENGFAKGEGLGEWSAFLGCNGKTPGLSGADVYPLYQLGHFDEIATYCAQDVAATRDVFLKVSPMFR